ncbi:hypothetical protein HYX06_02370 [Candidatus Woesearchaeota archaeon]|nr:hypothetical protein [Candidatus Woesearchaeota archaeon]
MVTKPTDISHILETAGIVTEKPVIVNETEDTYPIKADTWDNWFPFAYLAFQEIARSQTVSSFAAIGTGNGADALGAINIFGRDLETIIITDVGNAALQVSDQNVRRYSKGKKVFALNGSLCQPLIQRGIKVDLIYENLPNIPDGEDVSSGYRQASVYNPSLLPAVPDKLVRDYLLESHYSLLKESKHALNHGGSVICSIGGRVPNSVLRGMVERLGYKYEELITGFKRQTEPLEVLPGYAKAEKDGIEFDFYKYDEAISCLQSHGIKNPFIERSSDELKDLLAPFRISAREALQLYEQNPNYVIGHMVNMVRAINQ